MMLYLMTLEVMIELQLMLMEDQKQQLITFRQVITEKQVYLKLKMLILTTLN